MRIKSKYTHKFYLIVLNSISLLLISNNILNAASFNKENIIRFFNMYISKELTVVIISMLPIFELRGGIPVAIQMMKIPIPQAVILAIIGNIIPVILLLLFWEWLAKLLSKNSKCKIWIEKLHSSSLKKGKIIEKYEELGLMLFVAIPLPITGGWTGSLVAVLLGLSFWKSLLFIFIGILLASIVVTSLTILGKIGGIIAGAILISILILGVIKIFRERKEQT